MGQAGLGRDFMQSHVRYHLGLSGGLIARHPAGMIVCINESGGMRRTYCRSRSLMPDYLRLIALFGIVVVNIQFIAFSAVGSFAKPDGGTELDRLNPACAPGGC